MKPAPFDYLRPRSLAEALEMYASHAQAKVLAGGQSLLPLLSMRLAAPAVLVDLGALPELSGIDVDEAGARVGAMARHAEVERHPGVRAAQPLIAQALRLVAHPTIRNRGTTVGSIVHADAAAEMPAVLCLLDGHLRVASVRGERDVPAAELFVGPLETSLAADEIATQAYLPALAAGAGTAFEEVSRRHGDYALAGVGVVVLSDGDGVSSVRAGYISVADTPLILDLTDAFDGVVDAAALARAESLVVERVQPEADIHASADYRRHLAGVLTRRVVEQAYAATMRSTPPPSTPPPSTPPPSTPPPSTPPPSTPRSEMLVTRAPVRDQQVGSRRGGAPVGEQVHDVRLAVNGAVHDVRIPARRLLSDALRQECGLTGTHVGCEHGVCGSCTVLLDGQPARSCLMLAVSAEGVEITTVEGLTRADGTLGPVQQAFWECHGLQCGFCTPGFLTTVTAGLRDNPDPTRDEARDMIAGNLCRCTGYQNIVASIRRAAELMAAAGADRMSEGVPRANRSAVGDPLAHEPEPGPADADDGPEPP